MAYDIKIYQIGDLYINLESQNVAQSYSIQTTAEEQQVINSARLFYTTSQYNYEPRTLSIIGYLPKTPDQEPYHTIYKLQNMSGNIYDIIGIWMPNDEFDWMTNVALLKSVTPQRASANDPIELEINLVLIDNWKPLNMMFWEFGSTQNYYDKLFSPAEITDNMPPYEPLAPVNYNFSWIPSIPNSNDLQNNSGFKKIVSINDLNENNLLFYYYFDEKLWQYLHYQPNQKTLNNLYDEVYLGQEVIQSISGNTVTYERAARTNYEARETFFIDPQKWNGQPNYLYLIPLSKKFHSGKITIENSFFDGNNINKQSILVDLSSNLQTIKDFEFGDNTYNTITNETASGLEGDIYKFGLDASGNNVWTGFEIKDVYDKYLNGLEFEIYTKTTLWGKINIYIYEFSENINIINNDDINDYEYVYFDSFEYTSDGSYQVLFDNFFANHPLFGTSDITQESNIYIIFEAVDADSFPNDTYFYLNNTDQGTTNTKIENDPSDNNTIKTTTDVLDGYYKALYAEKTYNYFALLGNFRINFANNVYSDGLIFYQSTETVQDNEAIFERFSIDNASYYVSGILDQSLNFEYQQLNQLAIQPGINDLIVKLNNFENNTSTEPTFNSTVAIKDNSIPKMIYNIIPSKV